MSSKKLLISPAAMDDLKTIYQFGLLKWGQLQSTRYLEKLKERFWTLTEQPLVGIERPELLPNMRSLPIESHVIFYRLHSQQIEIIRVLHGKQDPHKQLK